MKKFLVLIVLFLGIVVSVNAQVQTYRTTGYYEKKLYSWAPTLLGQDVLSKIGNVLISYNKNCLIIQN